MDITTDINNGVISMAIPDKRHLLKKDDLEKVKMKKHGILTNFVDDGTYYIFI